jgi:hypothetical protein
MTRYFMLEMQRFGVRLAPVGAPGKSAGKSTNPV